MILTAGVSRVLMLLGGVGMSTGSLSIMGMEKRNASGISEEFKTMAELQIIRWQRFFE